MKHSWRQAAIGTLIAIAITSAMDASGFSAFSALPLLPFLLLFGYLQRFSWAELGFTWGRRRDYGLALLLPVFVLGLAALTAWITQAVNLTSTNWPKAGLNLGLVTVSTILVALVTEEGFFRGWLWASLKRSGQTEPWLLVWTSVAFAAWHWSTAVLPTGFNPPIAQAPIYLLNAAVLGFIWGLLRLISGSLVVASFSHGIWNGLAYVFFGFGARIGALGIHNTSLLGPEVGVLGLALNLAFAAGLWQWYSRAHATQAAQMTHPTGLIR